MKPTNIFFLISLFMITGCAEKRQSIEDLVTVDVTKKYPQKELILQDFMDVEYVPLETTDEFVTQGAVLDVSKNLIAARNRISDGDIFIFDRHTGKGLRKINRKGQGGEEYLYIVGAVLDEDNDEIYINSTSIKKILVYDLKGNFKRSLRHREGARYDMIYSFDKENLICHDESLEIEPNVRKNSFMIISREDGSVTEEIQIPYETAKTTVLVFERNGEPFYVQPSTYTPIITNLGSRILVELSSDTVYKYSPDRGMEPIIARSPSIQSMDPEVFLFINNVTDRYYFMEAVKKIYDIEKMTGLPSVNLVYDRQEKKISECIVYDGDYSVKKQVYMKAYPINDEIAIGLPLGADRLVEAYRKGELKGRLKEIAAGLDEEDNPVLMFAKHRK